MQFWDPMQPRVSSKASGPVTTGASKQGCRTLGRPAGEGPGLLPWYERKV